jgi:GNAT superfamily N-acetyltransferase
MGLATWWQGDPLPRLAPLTQFSAHPSTDIALLADLVQVTEDEIRKRFRTGSVPYIAYIDQVPTAYGWVASKVGDVIEINLHFDLPARNSYLWDFATLPAWRGKGIYPHLLQSIVRQEQSNFDRYWILYAPFNLASRAGIHKAGFQSLLEFNFDQEGFKAQPLISSERIQTAAELLDVPLQSDSLKPLFCPNDTLNP